MRQDGEKSVFATISRAESLFGSFLFVDVDNNGNPAVRYTIGCTRRRVYGVHPAVTDIPEFDFVLQPDCLTFERLLKIRPQNVERCLPDNLFDGCADDFVSRSLQPVSIRFTHP